MVCATPMTAGIRSINDHLPRPAANEARANRPGGVRRVTPAGAGGYKRKVIEEGARGIVRGHREIDEAQAAVAAAHLRGAGGGLNPARIAITSTAECTLAPSGRAHGLKQTIQDTQNCELYVGLRWNYRHTSAIPTPTSAPPAAARRRSIRMPHPDHIRRSMEAVCGARIIQPGMAARAGCGCLPRATAPRLSVRRVVQMPERQRHATVRGNLHSFTCAVPPPIIEPAARAV